MNGIKALVAKMPVYGRIACTVTLATHLLSYYIPLIFNANVGPESMTLLSVDERIPYIPGFVYIYVGAFVFWAVMYIYIYTMDRRLVVRVVTADSISKVVGILFYVLKPCWLDQSTFISDVSGFGSWLLKLIYKLDEPTNLLPSMHCFVSIMVVLPLFSRFSNAKPWVKCCAEAYALLVCASTVLIRQHVFADVWTAAVDAGVSWCVSLLVWQLIDKKAEQKKAG